jgi:hypothetical protein
MGVGACGAGGGWRVQACQDCDCRRGWGFSVSSGPHLPRQPECQVANVHVRGVLERLAAVRQDTRHESRHERRGQAVAHGAQTAEDVCRLRGETVGGCGVC